MEECNTEGIEVRPTWSQIFSQVTNEELKQLMFNKLQPEVIDRMDKIIKDTNELRKILIKIRLMCLNESEIITEEDQDKCIYDMFKLSDLHSIKDCNKLISVITYKTDLAFSTLQALKIYNDVSQRLGNVFWVRDLRDDEIIQEIIKQYT